MKLETRNWNRKSRPRRVGWMGLALLAGWMGWIPEGNAQTLRYSNHRDIQVPEYALLRIGPFYSDMTFSQSAGYRWTRSSGSGTDFLAANRRGVIREEGSDLPLVSSLSTRNYLIVTRQMDLDLSVAMSYAYYPLHTQDNAFNLDLPEEGVQGNLSSEFELTPLLKGTVHDTFFYRTDYVDTRGIRDEYGGQEYKHFNNTAGLDLDWLMSHDQNAAFSVSRSDSIPQSSAFDNQRRTSYSESLAYEQRVHPSTVAGLRAAFGQTDFDTDDRSDWASQQYTVFANSSLTLQTVGSAYLGYGLATVSAVEDSGEQDSSSIMGGLSLRTEITAGLSHSLSYSRGMQESFDSAYDIVDAYGYKLDWTHRELTAGFSTALSRFQPSSDQVPGYSAWGTSLTLSYPVISFARCYFSTSYDIRSNEDLASDADPDPELASDYSTWSSRVGTSFLVVKNVNFDTSFQHVERFSDSPDLEYERDVFSANLSYSHSF